MGSIRQMLRRNELFTKQLVCDFLYRNLTLPKKTVDGTRIWNLAMMWPKKSIFISEKDY